MIFYSHNIKDNGESSCLLLFILPLMSFLCLFLRHLNYLFLTFRFGKFFFIPLLWVYQKVQCSVIHKLGTGTIALRMHDIFTFRIRTQQPLNYRIAVRQLIVTMAE